MRILSPTRDSFPSPLVTLPITLTGLAGLISPGREIGVGPQKMQMHLPCGQ